MAIRLSQGDEGNNPKKLSELGVVMIRGAPIVGLTGGAVCLLSILWAVFGRMDSGFGSLTDSWNYLLGYLGSERFAYAFIWDIVLYSIFQPRLIGENLENVEEDRVGLVNSLGYIPVVGLVAYLLFLKREEELSMVE